MHIEFAGAGGPILSIRNSLPATVGGPAEAGAGASVFGVLRGVATGRASPAATGLAVSAGSKSSTSGTWLQQENTEGYVG